MNNETLEQAIERLCKRHMAKTLTILEQQANNFTANESKVIIKGFSYLMDDLKQVSKGKGLLNGKNLK